MNSVCTLRAGHSTQHSPGRGGGRPIRPRSLPKKEPTGTTRPAGKGSAATATTYWPKSTITLRSRGLRTITMSGKNTNATTGRMIFTDSACALS